VFGPYLLRGLVDLALAATRNLPAAMAALALYGVGTSTGMVTCNSLLQAHVRDQMRGCAIAAYDMIWQTGRLASLALGGIAAGTLGIQAVYLLGGLLFLVAGSIGLAGLRPIKETPSDG
jgi:predicted MFS family arabinose efflux permease